MGFFKRIPGFYRDQDRLFQSNATEIFNSNLLLLRQLLRLCVIIMFSLVCVSFLVESFAALRMAYVLLFLLGGALALFFHQKASQPFVLAGLYLDFSLCFLLMIYLSVIGSPQHMAVSLIGLLCIMPLAILDKSWRVNLFLLCFYGIHTALAFHYKEASIAFDDAVNGACFTLLGGALGEYVRMTKLENFEVKRQVQAQADLDFLTGLYNRRKMFELLESLPQTGGRKAAGVLMLDIDHFKEYNDRLGHLAGDACLRQISAAIREFGVRTGLDFFRYGGEEFLGLYYQHQETPLLQLAEELRQLVWELALAFPGSQNGRVTVSVGCALADFNGGNVDEQLIRLADDALYAAKAAGRNQSKTYPPAG